MTTARRDFTRRQFLGVTATAAAVVALGRLPRAFAAEPGKPKRKTILSFYCDDTKASQGGPKAFETFLDYCAERGIKGESSLILGMGGHGSITRKPTSDERLYLEQVKRSWQCGIDSQMELMTHGGLFDFKADERVDTAVHEGLWMHEPAVTVEEYQRYFQNIITEGNRADLRFTGITMPGCGCEVCRKRFAELRAAGNTQFNPNLWQALLNLAKQEKFRGPTVACFVDDGPTDAGIRRMLSDGKYGVYRLSPNADDHFGTWRNSPDFVNADYYITDDGKSGMIVRHVEAGKPYCLWYSHWQGLNPAKGVGWKAFTTVIERIRTHLEGRVVWMRPTDITNRYHQADGWSFLDAL